MQILAPLVAIAGLIAVAEGVCSGPNARTKPPKGAIVVDATGAYSGSVRTVADGVAKLPNTTAEHSLFVFPVTISHTLAQKDIPTSITRDRNDLTTTLRLRTDNIKVYNLNVANMAGRIKKNGQALAVSVVGTNSGFYACKFLAYQDTLYANKGANLYAKSYISGAVDFIYGQYANAWFESCDIVSISAGHITANGRDSDTNPSAYAFNNARVRHGWPRDGLPRPPVAALRSRRLAEQ
ncbi:putative pectinesterase [Phytophthora cinnamomi]|uniref:putative pectinesterase n=1 Tax=Phytophthora cinnamomi TaxID=4785 RepID=UPI00355A93AA|nr:putative pectinesterase [Phytophthora cinnamomi]